MVRIDGYRVGIRWDVLLDIAKAIAIIVGIATIGFFVGAVVVELISPDTVRLVPLTSADANLGIIPTLFLGIAFIFWIIVAGYLLYLSVGGLFVVEKIGDIDAEEVAD